VLFINDLNLERGHIDLEHLKRREGSLRKLRYEVKMVPVAGKQPVPIVTGRLLDEKGAGVPPKTPKHEDDLEFIVMTLRVVMGNRATTVELLAKVRELKSDRNGLAKGWGDTSFYDRLAILRDRGRIVGGGGKGEYISVVEIQPEKAGGGVQEGLLRSDHSAPKGGGAERSDLNDSESLRNHSGRSGRSDAIQGGEDGQVATDNGTGVLGNEVELEKADALLKKVVP
jgi:hypothetical protein